MTRVLIVLVATMAALTADVAQSARAVRADVLWDTYGVPHISAKDDASTFYAFGCAQIQSHGDLLLRLYGGPEYKFKHVVGAAPHFGTWRGDRGKQEACAFRHKIQPTVLFMGAARRS